MSFSWPRICTNCVRWDGEGRGRASAFFAENVNGGKWELNRGDGVPAENIDDVWHPNKYLNELHRAILQVGTFKGRLVHPRGPYVAGASLPRIHPPNNPSGDVFCDELSINPQQQFGAETC